jgi:hypothetical protein
VLPVQTRHIIRTSALTDLGIQDLFFKLHVRSGYPVKVFRYSNRLFQMVVSKSLKDVREASGQVSMIFQKGLGQGDVFPHANTDPQCSTA